MKGARRAWCPPAKQKGSHMGNNVMTERQMIEGIDKRIQFNGGGVVEWQAADSDTLYLGKVYTVEVDDNDQPRSVEIRWLTTSPFGDRMTEYGRIGKFRWSSDQN